MFIVAISFAYILFFFNDPFIFIKVLIKKFHLSQLFFFGWVFFELSTMCL